MLFIVVVMAAFRSCRKLMIMRRIVLPFIVFLGMRCVYLTVPKALRLAQACWINTNGNVLFAAPQDFEVRNCMRKILVGETP